MFDTEKFVDLTRTITDRLPAYPGDDETVLRRSRDLGSDGFNNHRLETGMHAGTHIDTPMHLTRDERYVCDFPIERFIGNGVLVDVRGESVVDLRKEDETRIAKGDVVLFYTGHGAFFGKPGYFEDYPVLSKKTAGFLASMEIKMIGLDSPSPDRFPFDVHKTLFERGIFIVENLTDLDELLSAEKFEVMAIPLKIRADSSIARVFARVF